MRSKLFQAEGDTFLIFIEIKNNNLDFLIQFDNLFRMADTSPTKVGNVDESVNAAQVDEYAIGSNIFNGSLEDLSFFQFLDDLGFLCFQFIFDQGFMGNYYVFVFMVDLHHFEFHDFVNKYIIIADGLHINL